jgi:glycosyltransferase involved in cell wall biosynthesis
MKKTKRAALFDPYLDALGGGEKHILSILKVLEEESDIQPTVFWDEDLSSPLQKKLNLRFKNLTFRPNVFSKKTGFLEKQEILSEFEYFFYVTDGSYFFSRAKRNYVFCMVPNKQLFTRNAKNWLKTLNYEFITNSKFTRKFIEHWGIHAKVLYPYIDQEYFEVLHHSATRKKQILMTGRFFEHLHSKRHDVAIHAFLKLREDPRFRDYKLILAGSVHKEDEPYFERMKALAHGEKSIQFAVNIPFKELVELYRESRFYWHCTGFGLDDDMSPERVEHLGIAPLEAMAAGCMTFCVRNGGPKEYIVEAENGFLFSTIDELLEQVKSVTPESAHDITCNARASVERIFSYTAFKRNVMQLFGEEGL